MMAMRRKPVVVAEVVEVEPEPEPEQIEEPEPELIEPVEESEPELEPEPEIVAEVEPDEWLSEATLEEIEADRRVHPGDLIVRHRG